MGTWGGVSKDQSHHVFMCRLSYQRPIQNFHPLPKHLSIHPHPSIHPNYYSSVMDKKASYSQLFCALITRLGFEACGLTKATGGEVVESKAENEDVISL